MATAWTIVNVFNDYFGKILLDNVNRRRRRQQRESFIHLHRIILWEFCGKEFRKLVHIILPQSYDFVITSPNCLLFFFDII